MRARLFLAVATTLVAIAARADAAGDVAPEDAEAIEPARQVSAAADDRGETATATEARRDHLRVGVLGGVGFPRPFAIEPMIVIERHVMLGFEYSFLPSTTVSGVALAFHAMAADVRVFPWAEGPFYVGVRAGKQHFDGATTLSVQGYGSAPESMTVDTWFVSPRLGLLWTWRSGLSAGIEAGVQVPVGHTSSNTLPSGIAPPAALTNASHWLGAKVLPTVTLLQLGMSF